MARPKKYRSTAGQQFYNVNLKYSAWSSDLSVWEERAPEAIKALKEGFLDGYFEEHGDEIVISSSPRRGDVTMYVTFTPYYDKSSKETLVDVQGIVTAEWDPLPNLASTLDLHEEEEKEDLEDYLEGRGFYTDSGSPGVQEHFDFVVSADMDPFDFDRLMDEIDEKEALVRAESEEAFQDLRARF